MKLGERCARIAAVAFVLALFVGCTTTGEPFSLAPVSESKGDIYLYRGNAFYASGSIFKVSVDGYEVGGLLNGSYLLLRLPPGPHRLGVSPPGVTFLTDVPVTVEAGKASFYEYVFQTGILANALYLGSNIEARERPVAIGALKELRAAIAGVVEPVPPYAALDDADAVPYLNAQGKAAYREWLKRGLPRAFVVSPSGRYAWAWGAPQNPQDSADPTERALARCRKNAGDCRVYAIDNRVVWQPPTSGDGGAATARPAPRR